LRFGAIAPPSGSGSFIFAAGANTPGACLGGSGFAGENQPALVSWRLKNGGKRVNNYTKSVQISAKSLILQALSIPRPF